MDMDTRAQQDLRYRGAKLNEKGVFAGVGVEMPLGPFNLPWSADQALQQFMPFEGGRSSNAGLPSTDT